mgnify:CR=1 FL=1
MLGAMHALECSDHIGLLAMVCLTLLCKLRGIFYTRLLGQYGDHKPGLQGALRRNQYSKYLTSAMLDSQALWGTPVWTS